MIMHKCDRCGTLFEMDHTAIIDKYKVQIKKPGLFDFTVDLCDECTESIRRWLIDPNATIAYDPATETPDYNRRVTIVDRVRKLFNIDKAKEAAEKRKEDTR